MKFQITSILLVLFTACQPEGYQGATNDRNPILDSSEHIYWVNSQRAECVSVGPRRCLQIQKGETIEPGSWQLFYAEIAGFNYDAGYIYKLIVQEEKLPEDQVPADASSIKYTLTKVLHKEMDAKLRLHDIWALQAINGDNIDPGDFQKHPQLEINLTDNRVLGNDGCNQFSGAIKTVDDRQLSFSQMAGTRMDCENMELTGTINQHLAQVQSYRINNLTLLLLGADGEELLRYKKVD